MSSVDFFKRCEMETSITQQPIEVDYHQAKALEKLSNFLKVSS
jgi:hypothetical protein